MKPRYSGEKSRRFWHRVNAIGGKRGRAIYALAVELQNNESIVLRKLREAEQAKVGK